MNKIEKIRDEVERRMYSHNLQADLAVSEEMFDEKVSNAKYEESKEILSAIDAINKDSRYSVWHGADEEPQEKREVIFQWKTGVDEGLWSEVGMYVKEVGRIVTRDDLVPKGVVHKWAYVDELTKF